MLKIIQKTTKKIVSFFNLLIIILLIFFNKNSIAFAENNNWVKVSRTIAGIQYIDIDSIEKKERGEIELKTKYLQIDAKKSKVIDENIYTMRINCLTNQFKDISINGKENLSAKWIYPKGDKLINDVISNGCKNV